jgi:hypothetical protein
MRPQWLKMIESLQPIKGGSEQMVATHRRLTTNRSWFQNPMPKGTEAIREQQTLAD